MGDDDAGHCAHGRAEVADVELEPRDRGGQVVGPRADVDGPPRDLLDERRGQQARKLPNEQARSRPGIGHGGRAVTSDDRLQLRRHQVDQAARYVDAVGDIGGEVLLGDGAPVEAVATEGSVLPGRRPRAQVIRHGRPR